MNVGDADSEGAGYHAPLALFTEANVGRVLVPHVHKHLLRRVDVFLVLHLLDVDTHAVLGEGNVLVANVLGCLRLDLVDAEVDLVADKGETADDDEEDDQGEELTRRERVSSEQAQHACAVKRQ